VWEANERGTFEDKDISKGEGEMWEELEDLNGSIGSENGDKDSDIITVDWVSIAPELATKPAY
jgi:hypothetical protein